jgi:hypothetical protein
VRIQGPLLLNSRPPLHQKLALGLHCLMALPRRHIHVRIAVSLILYLLYQVVQEWQECHALGRILLLGRPLAPCEICPHTLGTGAAIVAQHDRVPVPSRPQGIVLGTLLWWAARQVEFNCVRLHTIKLRLPHPRQSFEDRVTWLGATGRRYNIFKAFS